MFFILFYKYFGPISSSSYGIRHIFVRLIFTCVFICFFINMPPFFRVLIKFKTAVKFGRRHIVSPIHWKFTDKGTK